MNFKNLFTFLVSRLYGLADIVTVESARQISSDIALSKMNSARISEFGLRLVCTLPKLFIAQSKPIRAIFQLYSFPGDHLGILPTFSLSALLVALILIIVPESQLPYGLEKSRSPF